jgi:hypothetical protein
MKIKEFFMKCNNFLIALMLCIATQPTISLCLITKADAAKKAQAQKHDKSEFKNQKNMILEWAQSKTPEQLNAIKDTTKHLNPREGDTPIQRAAKQVAKEELFPELETTTNEPAQSWWRPYAPQFMHDLADNVNAWSTRKKIAIAGTILTGLAALYNKDTVMAWVQSLLQAPAKKSFFLSLEEKRKLGIRPSSSFAREYLSDKEKLKRYQENGQELWKIFDEVTNPLPNPKDEEQAQALGKYYYEYRRYFQKINDKNTDPIERRARAIAMQLRENDISHFIYY